MMLAGLLLLALLGGAFVLVPLLRRGAVSEHPANHDVTVREVYRHRQQELLEEAERAVLPEDLASELGDELGAVLLAEHDLAASTPTQAATSGGSRWLAAAAVLVVLGAGLIYLQIGGYGLSTIRGAEVVLRLNSESETVELASWQRRLTAHVERDPEDSKSWYLLGHAQLKTQEYGRAAESFAQTQALVGDDVSVLSYWLQARFLNAQGVLDPQGRNLAERVLALQPGHPVVLEVLALDAFRRSDYAEAVRQLNRALTGARVLDRQVSLATAITQARANLSGAAGQPPGVDVQVSTVGVPPAGAAVFVAARPVGGGMPFAAVRRPALMLPFSVRMDDLVSMSDGRLLSQAEQFEISVRLSTSGAVGGNPGDWQWQSGPISMDALPSSVQAELSAP